MRAKVLAVVSILLTFSLNISVVRCSRGRWSGPLWGFSR